MADDSARDCLKMLHYGAILTSYQHFHTSEIDMQCEEPSLPWLSYTLTYDIPTAMHQTTRLAMSKYRGSSSAISKPICRGSFSSAFPSAPKRKRRPTRLPVVGAIFLWFVKPSAMGTSSAATALFHSRPFHFQRWLRNQVTSVLWRWRRACRTRQMNSYTSAIMQSFK